MCVIINWYSYGMYNTYKDSVLRQAIVCNALDRQIGRQVIGIHRINHGRGRIARERSVAAGS